MDAVDFLTVAKQLLVQPDEASHRTSVSRSYYALYNRLHKEVASVHPVGTGHDAHKQVADCVAACKHMSLQKVAQDLNSLKADRLRADYKLMTPIMIADAQVCVARAEKAFTALGTFTPNDLEAQLRAARF